MSRRHYSRGRGEGHREADPTALADLLSDGGAATRHGNGDPAGRRGLLGHDRGRVRAPLLRRPRGARRARHPAARRQAGRGLLRAGELLARARGLPPARDRLHRRGARVAADRAEAARRRVRLRRAAAARAPADHLGPPEPARLARAALDRARHHRVGRRRRGLRPAGQDRHRDLPPQADRVRVLHDAVAARSRSAASTRTSCSTRAASSTSSATRTSATTCACSGSRASAARSPTRRRPSTTSSARPTSTRASTPTASHGSSATRIGTAEIWVSDRIAWHVERNFGPYGEMADAEDGDGRVFRTAVLDLAARDRVGARLRRARPHRRAAGARRRGARAARRDHRAPPRRAVHRASPRAARPAPTTPRPPRRRAARARRRRSGPSASPASSRSPPC